MTVIWGIVAAAYGTLATFALRFLYPAKSHSDNWQFVTTVAQLKLGQSITYISPAGARIVVARQRADDDARAFVALSSVCPHLGCAVHWEGQNNRFFCPCHNGSFDESGAPTGGPPFKANQSLPRFPVRVDRGRLFIQVPLESVTGDRQGVA